MIGGALLGFIATFWFRQKFEKPFSWLRTISLSIFLFILYFIFSFVLSVMWSGEEPSPGFAQGALWFAIVAGATFRMKQEAVELAKAKNWVMWCVVAYVALIIISILFLGMVVLMH